MGLHDLLGLQDNVELFLVYPMFSNNHDTQHPRSHNGSNADGETEE